MTDTTDEAALRRLLADYCHLVDDRDLEAWIQLFADDAVVAMGRHEFEGHAGIRGWIDSVIEASGAPGRHLCTNAAFDIDGDRATGCTDFLYVAPGPQLAQVGRYDDVYRRVGDGWRFERRRVSLLRA